MLELDSRDTSVTRARGAVVAYVREHCAWVDVFSVRLVTAELLANAVLHTGGRWNLRARCTRSRLVLDVADRDQRLPVARKPDLVEGGGLGMHIIGSLSSSFEIRPTPGGKILRVVWRRPG
ncbi:MAG TPA: ATP-binding protein [Actinospica sp.]|nr:ATP-binding protein [Actinospica sp.]